MINSRGPTSDYQMFQKNRAEQMEGRKESKKQQRKLLGVEERQMSSNFKKLKYSMVKIVKKYEGKKTHT